MRSPEQRVGILPAMFCMGIFSVLAQVLFMREMLVVFFGNELIIGTIFAAWLLGISVGAFSARFFRSVVLRADRVTLVLAFLLIVPALAFPLQVYAVRTVRLVLGVPVGGYASLGQVFLSAFVIFFPTCCSIGLFFPFACDALAGNGQDRSQEVDAGEKMRYGRTVVSSVYTFEAIGSMLGGVVLTYLLLPAMSPYRIVFVASGTALLGAVSAGRRCRMRRIILSGVLPLAIVLLACGLLHFRFWQPFETAAAGVRWRAFGILKEEKPGGSPGVVLTDSADTIYQNLALIESQEQYALYANGQLAFVFPDPIGYEHSIHFLMAQNPGVSRILLVGGCPVGDIPELLKYPLAELVYVELDPGVGRIIRNSMPREYDRIMSDPRVKCVTEDGPRFVQNCTETFDAVIVNAPEPTTTAANRFYTLEFYRNIRRILNRTGFIYTSVTSSERLEFETIDLGASVYQTLAEVFPVVLVTAEETTRFFAADVDAAISMDRLTLYMRSDTADIKNGFFRPEYLQYADEIAKDKVKQVKEKFASAKVPLNTNLKPVAFFYNLLLWNRFSGSRVESLLSLMKSLDHRIVVAGVIGVGMLFVLVGLLFRAYRIVGSLGTKLIESLSGASGVSLPANRSGRMGGLWARLMLGTVIATTGFCGMALEVLLIFVFQSLYGYVYTRLGLIVAVFMCGLVLGAPSGRSMAGRRTVLAASAMIGLELLLVGIALGVPKLAGSAFGSGTFHAYHGWAEAVIYVGVGLVGWAVGAEFVLANRLFCDAGGAVGVAAAMTDASDHLGAAAGSFIVGVLLVPVLGIQASCGVLAALKGMSLLCLLSAVAAMPAQTISRPRE